jgi:RNA recognition motif-containing protein
VKNIFVGNLDLGTTPESIRSFFEPVGAVHKVNLMRDRNTGLSRGFAFLEMADPDADKAIAALNGKSLDGREIDVHEARAKVHRHASPAPASHSDTPEQP